MAVFKMAPQLAYWTLLRVGLLLRKELARDVGDAKSDPDADEFPIQVHGGRCVREEADLGGIYLTAPDRSI